MIITDPLDLETLDLLWFRLAREIIPTWDAPAIRGAGAVIDVHVAGTTNECGFTGVMKRHGFGGKEASHGVERKHRSDGSIRGHSDTGTGRGIKRAEKKAAKK